MSEVAESDPNQVKIDTTRFYHVVHNAVTLVSKHPESQITMDAQGKPLEMSLEDEVELFKGKARVWVKVQPSKDPRHPTQPVTELTVADQFETYDTTYTDIKSAPVTRLRFFGDGSLQIIYGESVKDVDTFCAGYIDSLTPEKFVETSVELVSWFETNISAMDHQYLPHMEGVPNDDWDHVVHVEHAVETLLEK